MTLLIRVEQFMPRSFIAVATLLTFFLAARVIDIPPLWICVMAVLLACCALLKNMETHEKYHAFRSMQEPSTEAESAEQKHYLKFLNAAIQLTGGCIFSILIAMNLKRLGF